jgi:hypothetical protein
VLPSSRVLAQACELAGLDVIEPLVRTPTPCLMIHRISTPVCSSDSSY